jgi:class 3 adenylate cyclase
MDAETRYARNGDVRIAYQVVGEGELDLVFVPAFISNIELGWELPDVSAFLTQLASFTRLIQFDRRGNGMSDGASGPVPLEDQIDDVRAVLDAAGSTNPALMSVTEGTAMAVMFAATFPELVRALVLITPQSRLIKGPGYEWALSAPEREALVQGFVEHWGTSSVENPWMTFASASEEYRRNLARFQRLAMGPGDAGRALLMASAIDARELLPSIQCPTLVLRREGDRFIDERHSRYVADHVPGARYVELPGEGRIWVGDPEGAAREIEHFLTGVRPVVANDRVLATVLFTDIVGSTRLANELGDRSWRALLGRHDALVRSEVERSRGRFVKSLGDGALAVFDGPSRAIASAVAIRDGVHELGLHIRAGLHTGECELVGDDDVGGLAVHIGARIAALAGPDEVLTSGTVRDLTIGSGVALRDHGMHELKDVPGSWPIFAVAD